MRQIPGVALGGIPLLGTIGGQLAGFVNAAVEYDRIVTTREGVIEGSFRRGRLTIRWARGRPAGIPFRAYLAALNGRQELTSGEIPILDPWPGRARPIGSSLVVATLRGTERTESCTEETGAYWSANRVG